MKGEFHAVVLDTMISQHLLQPDLPHSLAFCASIFTQKAAWKQKKNESEECYCARDVDTTLQIWQQLKPMLRMEGLWDLYHDVQVPLAKICKLMTDTGFKLDPSRIKGVREKLLKEIEELESVLPEHMRTHEVPINKREKAPKGTLSEKTGKPLKYITVRASVKVTPWRSQKQVEKFLYEELELPIQRHVKTQRVTTDKQALERLFRKTQNPALNATRKLRKLDELLSNFVKQELVKTDSVHASFNPHGTSSGRLSSSGPNLQNQPEAARYIYVPSQPGWKIIDVDYSQIENRLTAYFADDQERLQRFILDPDFSEHKYATSLFFGIPYEEVEKDNSRDAPYGKAKSIVHGANYGMGARKIVNMYDLDFQEVKKWLADWKQAIAKTTLWQDLCAKEAYQDGFLTTPFGRKRWFYTSSYYCLTPETPILTADLRWVPVGTLKVGDELVGFDENTGGKGAGRKFRKALVESTGRKCLPCYQVATDRGSVTASSDHKFLVRRGQKRGAPWREVWVPARSLVVGDQIKYFGEPWVEDLTKEAGWLAGLLDGEGSLADYKITFAQNKGAVLERGIKGFKGRGYKTRVHWKTEKLADVSIAEENYQRMRLLGSLRPTRLLEKADATWNGRRISSRRPKYAEVLAVSFKGAQEVVPLQTSTRTILSAGFFSHNTEALSFLPQSAAADVIFRAMIGLMYERIGWPLEKVHKVVRVAKALPWPARLLVQVHDSLVLEAPEELVDEVVAVLTRVLTQPWRELGGMSIPIGVAVGDSWAEVKKYK